jgi:hypothetical protein
MLVRVRNFCAVCCRCSLCKSAPYAPPFMHIVLIGLTLLGICSSLTSCVTCGSKLDELVLYVF